MTGIAVQPLTIEGEGVQIAPTGTSAATVLPLQIPGAQCELNNLGTVTVFVVFGISTAVAVATTSYPVQAGHAKVLSVPVGCTHIACVTAGTTGSLAVNPVRGS